MLINRPVLCLFRDPIAKSSKNVVTDDDEDNELEEKVNRLEEMFPQLKRKELLEAS